MGYAIVSNYFVPKIEDMGLPELLHCIAYDKCNYNCKFCPKQYKNSKMMDYSPIEFESIIQKLIRKSNGFKFTGGEPTLNPRLLQDVSIVKKYGGTVFLDTNGSNPENVDILLRNNLLDVIGVSLKGTCEKKAMGVTNTSGTKCWTNVNETLRIVSKYDITTILTYVVDDKTDIRSVIDSLAHYALDNKRLYLKINNYFLNRNEDNHFLPVDERKIVDEVKAAIEKYPSLNGRVIVIKNKKAVSDKRNIVHL